MGALGGPLGLSGGAAGSNFAAPKFFDNQQAVNTDQTTQAYNQNQQALQQQQGLLNAINSQNGLGNQTGTYNQLGALNSQLGNVASGQGPNPAQAMLNNQTGANVANQAALMAGQRGVGSNVGLLARQAAMQGAGTQQQAVGQGAALQAQQSLGAMGQQAGVLGQQAGIANTMAGNQIGQTNAITGAQQAEQGNLLNALGAYNQANVGMQSNVNQGNMSGALQQMQQGEKAVGGFFNGMGSAMGSSGGGGAAAGAGGAAHGGVVNKMAEGGAAFGPSSEFGQFISGVQGGGPINVGTYTVPNQTTDVIKQTSPTKQSPALQGGQETQMAGGPFDNGTPTGDGTMVAAHGGMVDVVLSPGEKVVPPNKAKEAAGGKVEAKTVPGKAKVSGDSTKNDTFKTKLPEGSIVIPRTKSKDTRDSASFVRAQLAKRGKK